MCSACWYDISGSDQAEHDQRHQDLNVLCLADQAVLCGGIAVAPRALRFGASNRLACGKLPETGDALATPWRQDSSPSMRCCQTAMGTQPPTCFPWSQFKAPSPPKCSRPTSTGGPSSKARDTILAGGGGPLKDKGKEEPSSRRGRRQWKRPRQGQSKGGSWQAKGDASSWRENKTDSWAGLCRGH